MHRLRILLLLAAPLALLYGCGPDNTQRALTATADVIAADYARLHERAATLGEQSRALCSEPDASTLSDARQAWQQTMDAWMRVAPVGFGPVQSQQAAYKIQFWPDPRDMVARETDAQIEKAAEADDGALNLDEASVAVQGLPALEYLLFPDADAPLATLEQPGRCAVLTSVAAHLQQTSAALAKAWAADGGNFAAHLTHYGADATYTNADGALAAVLGSLVGAVETIKDSKLGWPLGIRTDNQPQPFRVESRRSQRSLPNIAANLAGMQQLLNAGDAYGIADLIREQDNGAAIVERMNALLDKAQQQAQSLPPLFPALVRKQRLDDYRALLDSLDALKTLLATQVVPALGVQRGFNFNDGD